jgi:RecA/RadA recombinase
MSFIKDVQKRNQQLKDKITDRYDGEETLDMGDPALQWAMGGWIRGRANLIYGPSGSGKTALALKAAASEQKKTKGWVVICDSEYAHAGPLNPEQEKAFIRYRDAGLDTDKVIVIQSNEPNILFGDLGSLEDDVKKGNLNVSAFVVDSWGGVQGESQKKKITEGKVAEAGNSYGGNAKVMGPILQHLLRIFAENGVTGFFVQHTMMNMDEYGPKYVLIGGQKLRFLVHGILFIESIAAKDASLLVGNETSSKAKDSDPVHVKIGKKLRAVCEKSRNRVEGRKVEFWFDFEKIRFALPEESLYNLAFKLDVVANKQKVDLDDKGNPKKDKEGKIVMKDVVGYYVFPVGVENPYEFHGPNAAIQAMKDNKDLYNQILEACNNVTKKDAVGGVAVGGNEVGFANAGDDYGDDAAAMIKKKKGPKK